VRRLLVVLLMLVAACDDARAKPSAPVAERVTYRVLDEQGAQTQQVTDLLGSYRARTITTKAGASLGGFLWDEHGVYNVAADGSVTQTEYTAPGFPGPASRLDLALPVGERQKLVTRLGAGSHDGQPCTRWLSLLPLDGASFAPATTSDRTESCVSASGRLLWEVWRSGGTVVRTRGLVSVTSGPTDLYGGKQPTPLPTSLSGVVVKGSAPEELAVLLGVPAPAGPAGLKADRSAAALDVSAQRDGFDREAGVFTWVGKNHLAVLRIERDLQVGGRTLAGERVELGALGGGYLEPVLAGLRVTVESGRLRLIATADLPEAQLLTWLRGLRLS
jgi:hypothetical protein